MNHGTADAPGVPGEEPTRDADANGSDASATPTLAPGADTSPRKSAAMQRAPRNVAAILLAAGASSRLGQPKQLVRLGGRPLVRIMAEAALASRCSHLTVVLGAYANEVRAALAGTFVETVENVHWREGMGASIATGVAAATCKSRRAAPPDAVLLLLCDQPALTTAHIDRLVATYEATGAAVASRYEDDLGVPALFTRASFARLAALGGGAGARSVLAELPALAVVDWPEGALDLDTPADLARWLPGHGGSSSAPAVPA
jgi:molybdenum cofactor cytidylyltransferase